MRGTPAAPALNAAQQEVVDRLGSAPTDRPEFAPGLRDDLRAELEERLTPIAARAVEPLTLNKHLIAQAMGCEARMLAEQDAPFVWTPPIARGSIAHRAIELAVHRTDAPTTLELVDDAIASLMQDTRGIGEYLQTCGPVELAECRSSANNRVAAFMECWPPLKASWRPVLESPMRATFCEEKITLAGRVDLTIGSPDGNRAGKVIVDFKTGAVTPTHAADLRFYALLETLRLGVPPRMLASYYLDAGRLQSEAVTVAVLHTAIDRVVDATGRVVTLASGDREPVLRPSPGCRWCLLLQDCEAGKQALGHDPELGRD